MVVRVEEGGMGIRIISFLGFADVSGVGLLKRFGSRRFDFRYLEIAWRDV